MHFSRVDGVSQSETETRHHHAEILNFFILPSGAKTPDSSTVSRVRGRKLFPTRVPPGPEGGTTANILGNELVYPALHDVRTANICREPQRWYEWFNCGVWFRFPS